MSTSLSMCIRKKHTRIKQRQIPNFLLWMDSKVIDSITVKDSFEHVGTYITFRFMWRQQTQRTYVVC